MLQGIVQCAFTPKYSTWQNTGEVYIISFLIPQTPFFKKSLHSLCEKKKKLGHELPKLIQPQRANFD
jgi:hypothetical protein